MRCWGEGEDGVADGPAGIFAMDLAGVFGLAKMVWPMETEHSAA